MAAPMSGGAKPPAEEYNRASGAQGAISLTAEPCFRATHKVRKEGRWVVHYCFAGKGQKCAGAEANLFYRKCGNFTPFTPEQCKAAEAMFANIEKHAAIRFVRVDDPKKADIRMFGVDFPYECLGMTETRPGGGYDLMVANRQNVPIPNDKRPCTGKPIVFGPDQFRSGTDWYGTLLHEAGHALGLSHPDKNPFGGEHRYVNGKDGTIMSYVIREKSRPAENNVLGRYDIAALQYLYGPPPGRVIAAASLHSLPKLPALPRGHGR